MSSAKNGEKGRRGLASIDPKRRKEIARLGALAMHAKGLAHKFTPDEAKAASKKAHTKRAAHSEDKSHLMDVSPSGDISGN